jgi:hypothetical protein
MLAGTRPRLLMMCNETKGVHSSTNLKHNILSFIGKNDFEY